MTTRNTQTVVASSVKAINKAMMLGALDSKALKNIQMFAMVDYYINFTQETIDNGFDGYKEINNTLKTALRQFTYCNPEVICNYKIIERTSSTVDFLASNATITIDTTDIKISQLQI